MDERGGEEMGGVEGGGTVFRLYCIRKEFMFNKGGKLKTIKHM